MRNIIIKITAHNKLQIERFKEQLSNNLIMFSILEKFKDNHALCILFLIPLTEPIDIQEIKKLYNIFTDNKDILPSIVPYKEY